MKIVILIVITLLFTVITACSARFVPVRVPCPPDPEMRPVEVIDNTISGKSLDNTIDNHIDLWTHIHKLKKLGCAE